jgi:cytochrome c-type biogenesis protein CcmH/NrfG
MLIGAKITGKVLIVAGVVTAMLLTGLGITRCQLKNAHQEKGVLEQNLAQCHEDNRHQTEQVDELTEEINALTDTIAIERAAFESARIEAERRDRQRERDEAAEQRARQVIYDEHPDCDDWAQMPVCPEIAERMVNRRQALIERWEGDDGE